jgi:tetratricopeptide (TPR) repeat protein
VNEYSHLSLSIAATENEEQCIRFVSFDLLAPSGTRFCRDLSFDKITQLTTHVFTMTAPAAKIKAFLAAIKESLLDIDTISLEESYLTLLRLEMLQRGVLCTERDPSKILEAVRDSAGKAVLTANTSAVPKPLLAACAVMAGRSAEQGVQALQGGSSAERESLAKLLDRALLKSTTDRCKDVQEDRLATILQLSSTAMDLTDMVLQKQLLYIAEGYFYRAASFQPDAPPMWKRAWDVIQARQRLDQIEDTHVAASPWEAVTALTHLRRVAMAKGNSKRSAELSLLLAESLLNVPTEQQGDKTCIPVIQAFVAPFRPLNPLPYIQRADQAAAAMNDPSLNGAELSDDDTFLSKILAVRVGSCSEDATLKQTAQDELVLAKNRNKVGVSLEKYIFKVRRSHLATVANDLALDTSAVALRDALFAKQVTEEQNYRKRSAYSLIQCYLCRQCDIARAIGVAESEKGTNTRGWLSLVVFLEPILSAFQQKAGWDTAANLQGRQGCIQEFLGASSCAEERNLFETAAMLLPSTEWMCCGRSKHDLVLSLTLLRFAQDALSVLHNKATKLYLEVQTSSVVKSTVDAGEKAIWRLESALATTRALCALTTAGSGRPVVVAALSRVDKTDYAELNGEFGAAFFEFLRCWSGIHQTPWELCRLSEARRLIRKARACIEKATTEWGRRASPLETLLLDLGEADAEGVVFVGGMLGEASKLYNGILGASDRLSQLGSVQRDLVCSRCYTGLSSLALEQHSANSGESTAEGAEPDATARKGLHCLQQIDLSQELAPLYFWSHQGATESAVRFQIVKSRQLIADALLRNERNQDAQKMLEDAVHDAPEDAGASFAFGAFRLRLMFHGGERSSMSDKAVQIQLLKAAKLDPSKASPFALLGHWYEHFEDIKRAVGCYSKALLLDPANPVAGRGLLRLKSADDLNTILNNAINSDSSLHGWAWRAVGLQKAMIEDEDELAVVSFLKALRCRDIERPEAEPMAIFFSDPTQAWERPLEMMEVSAELAACYKRLGRYTAAIRTFHAAIDWAGDDVPPKLLCACAQCKYDG